MLGPPRGATPDVTAPPATQATDDLSGSRDMDTTTPLLAVAVVIVLFWLAQVIELMSRPDALSRSV